MEHTGLEPVTSALQRQEPKLQVGKCQGLTGDTANAYTEAYIECPDSMQIDPDLALICERWEALPDAVKTGIMAMVKSVEGEGA